MLRWNNGHTSGLTVDIVVVVEPADAPLKWRVCKLTGHCGDISFSALLCSLMMVWLTPCSRPMAVRNIKVSPQRSMWQPSVRMFVSSGS